MTGNNTQTMMDKSVITFPKPVDAYFGTCPKCHRHDGFLNIGSAHWLHCKRHKVKWLVGNNLFSGWRNEPEQQHTENHFRLSEYREIENG